MDSRALTPLILGILLAQSVNAQDIWTSRARVGRCETMPAAPTLRVAQLPEAALKKAESSERFEPSLPERPPFGDSNQPSESPSERSLPPEQDSSFSSTDPEPYRSITVDSASEGSLATPRVTNTETPSTPLLHDEGIGFSDPAAPQPGHYSEPCGYWCSKACALRSRIRPLCDAAICKCNEINRAIGYDPALCGCGWDIGGWLAIGTTMNGHGNRTSSGNLPFGFNNYADGPILNQAWLYGGKEVSNSGCGFDWGFRVDLMFGADGPDTQAFGDGGWDESWDTSSQYGFAMPQYYGELAWNRLTARFGHFYTIIGYEVVQSPENFFYSHSYTMYYNEPFTHTGGILEYEWSDNVTVWTGLTAGWDSGFGNRNDGTTFLGGIRCDLGYGTIAYATSFGDPGDRRKSDSDVYMHSIVGDFPLTDRLNYVVQSDYQTRRTDGVRARSYGINQYLTRKMSERWNIGTRLEWFDDAGGKRIGNGVGDYWGLTFGNHFRPRPWWLMRSELRWDWFDGAGKPYDRNTGKSQFTFGTSAVFEF